MIKCPNCQTDILDINMIFCHICGTKLKSENAVSEDTEDFTDSENSSTKHHYENNYNTLDADDLGIESNSDLIDKEASETTRINTYDADFDNNQDNSDSGLIGDSAAPLPSQNQDEDTTDLNKFGQKTNKFNTLSDEDLKKIEKNLYSDQVPSADEKASTLERLNHLKDNFDGFENAPIVPPKQEHAQISKEELKETEQKMAEQPKPSISQKSRGIAYFYKNYIELAGSQRLHEDDQLVINQREYLLKPKAINSKVKYGFLGTVFVALLVFVGSLFMQGNSAENGLIVGVALDDNAHPYISGATIILPDLGKSVTSDAQGFFKFTNIPPGPHKIRYMVGEDLIKEDYITVVENQTSLTLLSPEYLDGSNNFVEEDNSYNTSNDNTQANTETTTKPSNPPTNQYAENKTKEEPKSNITNKTKNTQVVRTKSKYGKVSLSSNVNNAKLIIDGNVMGAGDLTYSNIQPGSHSYLVSSDGYESVSGKFKLDAGSTKTISVKLKPLMAEAKEEQYNEDDYYYSAQNAYNDGEYKTAVSDINKYLDENPGNADAYFIRAKAYTGIKDKENAYDDYIRAAEIYQLKKDYNRAITCYNYAIEMEDKDPAPYLGRGNLYLNKKEYIAAVTDFDKVISLDKRNFYGYYGMGEALYQQGRYRKAIDYFKDARSIDDKSPMVHQYLMLSYLNDNDIKNVLKSYDDFSDIATTEEMIRFENNRKYAAVRRIVDTKK